jgi:hypothetical protein
VLFFGIPLLLYVLIYIYVHVLYAFLCKEILVNIPYFSLDLNIGFVDQDAKDYIDANSTIHTQMVGDGN